MPNDCDIIVWCAPDGSWGECQRGELIIVAVSDMTDDELSAYDDAASDGADGAVLKAVRHARERINDEHWGRR